MDLQAFEALTLERLQFQNHRRPEKSTPIQQLGAFSRATDLIDKNGSQLPLPVCSARTPADCRPQP
jgi:hypothetical protein